jgi:hypothetical protein
MPAPKLPEYPKPMFRGEETPNYAKDEKDEDRLASEGWSVHYNYQEYPKTLYSAVDRGNVVVKSKDEERQALDQGWLAKPEEQHYGLENPNAPKDTPMPVPTSGGPTAEQFALLQQQILEQQKLLNSLLLDKQQSKVKKGSE